MISLTHANRSMRTLIVRPSICMLLSLAHAAAASSGVLNRTVPKPLQGDTNTHTHSRLQGFLSCC